MNVKIDMKINSHRATKGRATTAKESALYENMAIICKEREGKKRDRERGGGQRKSLGG